MREMRDMREKREGRLLIKRRKWWRRTESEADEEPSLRRDRVGGPASFRIFHFFHFFHFPTFRPVSTSS
jgi:hypothetical protein